MRRSNGTFLPSHSPGRPKGARNRLQSSFLHALAEDFAEHGATAIKICRIEEPARYVQIVASLMPKELEVAHNALGDMSDEELLAALQSIRQLRESAISPMDVNEPAVEALKVIGNGKSQR
jgi:hypothetical protein